ncbi:hypothetical protein [Acinetobacter sp. P8-3-8]|uniref:hypothetical protein n=1 Tax=Acinetobacter sp. P8-3-8 TaxID=1029823 RepID=UPI00024859C7|nr:hypothetical protein [Acinetobacter sp. P8-3-8]
MLSKQLKITKKNLDASLGSLIFNKDGDIGEIKRINRLEIQGESFFQKFKSAFFGVYKIEVIIEQVEYSFPEVTKIIAQAIKKDAISDDPLFSNIQANIENTLDKIKSSKSIVEIFEILQINDLDSCLDQL